MANTIKTTGHPAASLVVPLPSGRRYRSLKCSTSRFAKSFFSYVERSLNHRRRQQWAQVGPPILSQAHPFSQSEEYVLGIKMFIQLPALAEFM